MVIKGNHCQPGLGAHSDTAWPLCAGFLQLFTLDLNKWKFCISEEFRVSQHNVKGLPLCEHLANLQVRHERICASECQLTRPP